MAREQQRHHLVAQVLVAEAPAVLVLRVEQQGEEVRAALAGRPPPGDLAEDDLVEPPPRRVHPRPRRARAAQDLQEVVARVERQRVLELRRRVHLPAHAVGVEAEERAHGDAQRQLTGRPVEVDLAARLPALERPVGLLLHRGVRRAAMRSWWKAGSMILRERRWKSPSIVSRPSPSSGHQLAEAAVAPREVLRVGDEHVVVGLGPEGEDVDVVQDPQAEDRPVALVGVQQHRQRVAEHRAGARHRERDVPRRQLVRDPSLVADVAHHPPDGVRRQRGGRAGERHRRDHTAWLAGQPVPVGVSRTSAHGAVRASVCVQ